MSDAPTSPSALEQRALAHAAALLRPEGGPAAIDTVGILGAGIMGTAIAAAHVRAFRRVVLYDNRAEALAAAVARVAADLGEESFAHEAQAIAGQLVVPTGRLEPLAECGLVLEAIAENAAAKKGLYAAVEPHLRGAAILASNTSTIPISQLAAGLRDPGRFCGIHFCHPVRRRPLVEVICGRQSRDTTRMAAVSHVAGLGKLPVVVGDGPGFVVNRLLAVYLNEAVALLHAGVPHVEIDRAMLAFGMAMGPFQMLDEFGIDTSFQASLVMARSARSRQVRPAC